MSLEDSVCLVEPASIKYQLHLSTTTMCSNENRAALIIYYLMLIPSDIDLDHCSTHHAITEIGKKQLHCDGGLNLQPCP